jgi:hypothetical protein
MNPEKLHSRQRLDNGLILELWDLSWPVAGDRWYVALESRIAIPVKEANLPPELLPQAGDVKAALGREIVFAQKDERNFIAGQQVPEILREMEGRAQALAANYFGHPDFARRLLRKKYAEHLERRRRFVS